MAAEICNEIGLLATLQVKLPDGVINNGTNVSGRALSGYRCAVEPYLFGDGSDDYLQKHDDVVAQIPNLLQLFYTRRAAIGSRVDGFGINLLGRRGLIEPHRDAYLFPASAVTLSGLSRTTITDPVTEEKHTFDLEVGDAFVIQNPADGPHPEHAVRNPLRKKRIAFVI